ncbi:2-amino-4-hydroxy-6-hydroxymethyldihydropteridine pyrophosphokinase [Caldalkalibacillus thermarum TA2.A1]|uniref:2-amino-4-hydroxy-6-hydroxymethyldihydropteridine diphosphokinase n=1 Tax=Caldalkalibacillus thermarum (strain TA2.A1) TaxID=986075 RepID=F5L398_CALTT|nr:2-amino-4-hydroxy-6-hydroxymethyldihydropteridine diphosphokinase [Caldalkalibacillus thermarum]EGL84187.1 2-amino-4-hydroxy-6-hydroxymethyldihydropteridine pyrophosphokinase [Caldalkalibacillus thermarum TA2.A1]QZT34376.1 2-amino-4-hydroxy-6-hydroxymethyldihydropteridine diphosphokinase [Caldalkalibacillus thermarum TA2.A1]GGK33416.1 2-amino-4-hydroxy-6-hydroxymethyldihydropteridine pyrophosphokinase [Caldalkalibacillus thermarum]
MSESPFYLALGSNLGQREGYLRQALNGLIDHPGVRLSRLSSIYETEPVGYVDQPPFLNMAVKGETSLTVHELLGLTQSIEKQLGRTRDVRWGPRTIDIDILLYDHLSLETKYLKLPHPRMTERAFVLVPLAEIAPDVVIPGIHQPVRHLLEQVNREGVEKWKISLTFGADGYVHFAN